MNIHEVFEYGPIVFADEDTGVLITVNGAYLNWWNPSGHNDWINVDCRSFSSHNDLYKLQVIEAMDLARQWFEDELKSNQED
jgi:hypothetical protein